MAQNTTIVTTATTAAAMSAPAASRDEPVDPLASPASPPLSREDTTTPPLADGASPVRSPPRMASDLGPTPSISNMTASSQPLGNIASARRPPPSGPRGNVPAASNPDIAARMRAFHLSRQNTPATTPRPSPAPGSPAPEAGAPAGFPANVRLPAHLQRPGPGSPSHSAGAVPGSKAPGGGGGGMSLAEKRGLKLPGGLPAPGPAAPGAPPGRQKPKMKLSDMGGGGGGGANGDGPHGSAGPPQEQPKQQSQMEKYAQFIDTKNGALTFKGKATVNAEGIEFTTGKTFRISLDEVDTLDELGKGNYGTVYRVRHARPQFRRAGQGLAGNKALRPADREDEAGAAATGGSSGGGGSGGTTGIVMAMKEMRLELDDAKFQSIIMELDILHRCISPYIIDFYGAFFQEGCVYLCIEYMDGGSMDKLYGDGVPENVLRKVTLATVLGLKSLKEEHNIIHRDVKPTNILVNTRGQVKICDFGVSGNLVASIAKTNIGCQSYMAPERISGGGMASAGAVGGTYSVQSDIWSLGLTIIECAMGRYPYPPETYDNIFSQLSVSPSRPPPSPPSSLVARQGEGFFNLFGFGFG